ncbi:uncharacterized UDP-glucosyltransferase YjiC-like [Tetranychus urticae]|uniref:UDP-glycosyltransferase 203A1 n=1 Tax=Tetranychus urticae TaxID=32264 RepID=T1JRJ0_TETUR|nr:uncharacterized UDP-glucosyltransferase YjiC-like [Tetranychus urticae]AHX56891.1 UDP-glycosyltransferase 203A1 [Tetranychus urticae]
MKIFFLPMDGHGHINACIGLARMLRDYNHECTFAVTKPWINLIKDHEFAVETLHDPTVADDQDCLKKWGTFMFNLAYTFSKPPKEQIPLLSVPAYKSFIDYVKIIDHQLPALFEKLAPDLIIIDFYVTVPSIVKSGRPWILLYSCNPLKAYSGPNVPPSNFGLSVNTDPATSAELRSFLVDAMKDVKAEFDEWLKTKQIEPHPTALADISPYLNLYSYPTDLDYSEFGPVPDKWFRLDHMIRKVQGDPLGFDEAFFDRPGKKIYFSLGSMGGADVDLMKRMVNIMSKSKHLFIVSKGPFHDHFELAENMIGYKFINQMAVLSRVDLVIHHGGNNTFVETLYFGKPCIVLPLSGDQRDNGKRVEEKKIGRSFLPHSVDENEFLTAIDQLLDDQELIDRLKMIGENIRSSKSIELLNEKIKDLVSAK